MSEGRRPSVVVGCAYPSIRTGRWHQATCSCGWEGPRRRKLALALRDQDEHVSPADVQTALEKVVAEGTNP